MRLVGDGAPGGKLDILMVHAVLFRDRLGQCRDMGFGFRLSVTAELMTMKLESTP